MTFARLAKAFGLLLVMTLCLSKSIHDSWYSPTGYRNMHGVFRIVNMGLYLRHLVSPINSRIPYKTENPSLLSNWFAMIDRKRIKIMGNLLCCGPRRTDSIEDYERRVNYWITFLICCLMNELICSLIQMTHLTRTFWTQTEIVTIRENDDGKQHKQPALKESEIMDRIIQQASEYVFDWLRFWLCRSLIDISSVVQSPTAAATPAAAPNGVRVVPQVARWRWYPTSA